MTWTDPSFISYMNEANTVGELRTRNEYWNEHSCCTIQFKHMRIFCKTRYEKYLLNNTPYEESILQIARILLHHYTTEPYVEELCKRGDIQNLQSTLRKTQQNYSWNSYINSPYTYGEISPIVYPLFEYNKGNGITIGSWVIKENSFEKDKILLRSWLNRKTQQDIPIYSEVKWDKTKIYFERKEQPEKQPKPVKKGKPMFNNIHLVHDMTPEIADRICRALEQQKDYTFRIVQNVKTNLTVMVSPKNKSNIVKDVYTVVFTPYAVNCSCPDHEYRETDAHPLPCKHIFMTQFHTAWKPPIKEKK